jgi:hypothetical protein
LSASESSHAKPEIKDANGALPLVDGEGDEVSSSGEAEAEGDNSDEGEDGGEGTETVLVFTTFKSTQTMSCFAKIGAFCAAMVSCICFPVCAAESSARVNDDSPERNDEHGLYINTTVKAFRIRFKKDPFYVTKEKATYSYFEKIYPSCFYARIHSEMAKFALNDVSLRIRRFLIDGATAKGAIYAVRKSLDEYLRSSNDIVDRNVYTYTLMYVCNQFVLRQLIEESSLPTTKPVDFRNEGRFTRSRKSGPRSA